MSATGRVERGAALGASWPRRVVSNIAAMVALLVRSPPPGAQPLPLPGVGTIVLGVAISAAAIAAAMLWLDGGATAMVRQAPPWLIYFFEEITDFGKSGWFLWPIGVLLLAIALLIARPLPHMTRLVLASLTVRLSFVFLAISLPGLAGAVIKRVIGRARPLVEGDNAFAFSPFDWRAAYASMPSGHGTTAFAAAVAIGALWPRLRPLMWTYAVLIGLSRIAVLAHHPSDVVASAIFGVVGALLVRHWFAARRLGFVVGSYRGVSRLPGPSFRRTKAVARRLLSA